MPWAQKILEVIFLDETEIARWREAGQIAHACLHYGRGLIQQGTTYLEVANKIEARIEQLGGRPAFPINIAVNDIAAHYTPAANDELRFNSGDLVKLDVGVHVDGYIGDNALTVEVDTSIQGELLAASREALEVATELVRPGVQVQMIGAAVEQTIQNRGLVPISNLTGHGIARYRLHADISIPNIREMTGPKLRNGQVLAIEPFATNGAGRVGDAGNSNIYRVTKLAKVRQPQARKLLKLLQERYRGLPFAGRWIKDLMPDFSLSAFRNLIRAGLVKAYPIFAEKGHGMVSQHEYTLLVISGGCEVLTRPR